MKLKGKSVDKMDKEDIRKKESTLKKMKDLRLNDTKKLRLTINKKLEELRQMEKDGFDKIKKLEKELLKIRGAIIVLEELIGDDNGDRLD